MKDDPRYFIIPIVVKSKEEDIQHIISLLKQFFKQNYFYIERPIDVTDSKDKIENSTNVSQQTVQQKPSRG